MRAPKGTVFFNKEFMRLALFTMPFSSLPTDYRPLSGSGRYASPSPAQQPQARRTSSNASAASLYSAEALQQQQQQASERTRRAVNSSPLRGSTNSAALPSSGSGPRRYASPAPQQQQQYDFDSLASGGTTGSNRGSRSSTPTSGRATWKF